MVLQSLHNLSDERTEYLIRDRMSFMRFLDLELEDPVPDATTIWLFREALAQAGLIDKLFERFGQHLEAEGYIARGGQIIDATIVSVPKQRNTKEENETIKAGKTPEGWEQQPAKNAQKDKDARWTKKNDASFYGYKNHLGVDKAHKLIRKWDATDAAVHDSQKLDDVLDLSNTGKGVWADSAYRSVQIEAGLKAKGLQSRIHRRAARNRPLSERQKSANTTRSKVRARVEHVFGHQQNSMGGKIVRTIGIARARFKIGMMNLDFTFKAHSAPIIELLFTIYRSEVKHRLFAFIPFPLYSKCSSRIYPETHSLAIRSHRMCLLHSYSRTSWHKPCLRTQKLQASWR